MGGFIILQDGRALAPNNWAFDRYVERIADELSNDDAGRQLREWILDRRCEVQGMGLGYVDVRELTSKNQTAFREAAERALLRARHEGPIDPDDPVFSASWLRGFERLVAMWQAIDRGEPPSSLNDLTEPLPTTGEKSGPGW